MTSLAGGGRLRPKVNTAAQEAKTRPTDAETPARPEEQDTEMRGGRPTNQKEGSRRTPQGSQRTPQGLSQGHRRIRQETRRRATRPGPESDDANGEDIGGWRVLPSIGLALPGVARKREEKEIRGGRRCLTRGPRTSCAMYRSVPTCADQCSKQPPRPEKVTPFDRRQRPELTLGESDRSTPSKALVGRIAPAWAPAPRPSTGLEVNNPRPCQSQ